VFYFEKGTAYYFSNHGFMAKLSVFIVVGVLSAIPIIEFMSWRTALKASQVPAPSERKITMIRKLLHGELIGVVIILLCAAIMARGGLV
jgi:putative membrane protein